MRQKKSVRPCVCAENSEFYRGALARVTFPVSEVNIACRNFVDFAKINHCEGGSLFKKVPKKDTFWRKMSANCRWWNSIKLPWKYLLGRPESGGFCGTFRYDVDGVRRLAQTCFWLIHAKAPKGATLPCGFNLVRYPCDIMTNMYNIHD